MSYLGIVLLAAATCLVCNLALLGSGLARRCRARVIYGTVQLAALATLFIVGLSGAGSATVNSLAGGLFILQFVVVAIGAVVRGPEGVSWAVAGWVAFGALTFLVVNSP